MTRDPHQPIPATIAEAAAAWLARRDRGLTAAEQDEYMQWLAADSRHAESLSQHAAALERMMQLYEWTPAHDTEPNPQLFKSSRTASARDWLRRNRGWVSGLAAAAAVLLAVHWKRDPVEEVAVKPPPPNYLRVNERLALPDGSRVELKDGTRIVVQYSATERRVLLTGGEAHFSVWKNRDRPFVVDAAGVEVRAVGTAFNVRLGAEQVEVLVTEGRVRVEQALPLGDPGARARAAPDVEISVGERAVVPITSAISEVPASPMVIDVTLEDIARELAWQAPRLQFHETPLADAVAEFNRLNREQMVMGDPRLNDLRIGGTFRPDNVEGFVRLLDDTMGIRAERNTDNHLVLRRAK